MEHGGGNDISFLRTKPHLTRIWYTELVTYLLTQPPRGDGSITYHPSALLGKFLKSDANILTEMVLSYRTTHYVLPQPQKKKKKKEEKRIIVLRVGTLLNSVPVS